MLEECSSSTRKKRKEGKNIIFIAFLTPKFTSDNTLPSHKNLLSSFFSVLDTASFVFACHFFFLCSSSYSILNKRFIVNEEVPGLGWEGENVFFLFFCAQTASSRSSREFIALFNNNSDDARKFCFYYFQLWVRLWSHALNRTKMKFRFNITLFEWRATGEGGEDDDDKRNFISFRISARCRRLTPLAVSKNCKVEKSDSGLVVKKFKILLSFICDNEKHSDDNFMKLGVVKFMQSIWNVIFYRFFLHFTSLYHRFTFAARRWV